MANLNSTSARCDPDLLIFNRVPKVGSQTIQNLIGILRVRNGFDAFTSIEDMPEHFTGETTWIPDRGSRQMTVDALLKGPFIKDVRNIFGLLDPLPPPCPHFG